MVYISIYLEIIIRLCLLSKLVNVVFVVLGNLFSIVSLVTKVWNEHREGSYFQLFHIFYNLSEFPHKGGLSTLEVLLFVSFFYPIKFDLDAIIFFINVYDNLSKYSTCKFFYINTRYFFSSTKKCINFASIFFHCHQILLLHWFSNLRYWVHLFHNLFSCAYSPIYFMSCCPYPSRLCSHMLEISNAFYLFDVVLGYYVNLFSKCLWQKSWLLPIRILITSEIIG